MRFTGSNEPPSATHSAACLAANLAALARRDAELAERLGWPVENEHVVFDEQGTAYYVMHRDAYPLAAPDVPGAIGAERVLLLGVGAGELLDAALASPGQRELVVWERDPWLLRLALMRRDLRAELGSGRLRLVLGPDLLAFRGFEGVVLAHPVLATPYQLEIESFLASPRPRRALVCVGKLFVRQVSAALSNRGYELWSLDVARHSTEELERTMRRFAPELVVSINYTPGLVEFCHEHRTKLVVWEVDPSQFRLPPCESPTEHAWIWTHRRRNVEEHRAIGFVHAEYLPLAADPDVRHRVDVETSDRPAVSFVGNSLVGGLPGFQATFLEQYARWRGQPPASRADGLELLGHLLAGQREEPARFVVPALLEREAPGFRAAVLADRAAPDPAILAGEIAGAEKRLGNVARLGPHGVRVWGDAGWETVTGRGVRYMGTAGHGPELTRIYNESIVNLDIGRIYQPDIVTMRVFDVLACGGFVLADHSDALVELFEVGREVDSYRDADELVAKVAHWTAHPEAARDLAERGRERVLREHTIAQRVDRMLAAL